VNVENEKTRDDKPKATPVNGQTRGIVVERIPGRPNLIRRRDYGGAKRCCIRSGFVIQHEWNEESRDPADRSFWQTIILLQHPERDVWMPLALAKFPELPSRPGHAPWPAAITDGHNTLLKGIS
jgi:hypothetical protein